jgi:hypothetical protein
MEGIRMEVPKGIKIIIRFMVVIIGLIILVYVMQAVKLQYTIKASLSGAILKQEITQEQYEQLMEENGLIMILLKPEDVWATD